MMAITVATVRILAPFKNDNENQGHITRGRLKEKQMLLHIPANPLSYASNSFSLYR